MADTRGPREFSFEEAVDAAASAMRAGESLDRALGRFPQRASAMRAPLSALEPVLAMPAAIASPASRSHASTAMFAALATPPRRRMTLLAAVWPALGAGRLRYKAAAAGLAVVLFGGIGFASAAGDSSPVRVPGFLHVLSISSDNAIQFHGEIVSVNPEALVLRTSSGDRTVSIDSATVIRLGGVPATSADLAPGQIADVRATRAADGALRARRIDAVTPPAIPPATVAPGLPPASDLERPTPGGSDDHSEGDGAPGVAGSPKPSDDHESGTAESGGDGDDERSGPSTGSSTPESGGGDEREDRTPSTDPEKTPTAAPDGHATATPEHSGEHEADGTPAAEDTPEPGDH